MKTLLRAILIFLVLFFENSICFAENDKNIFILPSIKAETGDGSRVNVMLRMGRLAKGEIYDISGVHAKGNFIQESPREMIIVSNGFAKILTKEQLPLDISGEFFVDNLLNLTVKGSWDGKKEGAVHMLMGRITMFDYEFVSNSNYPLIFQITRDGYVYQDGTGRVKDLKTGEVYILVAIREGMEKYQGGLIDRVACEKECCELLIKGQVKQGVTIEECVKAMCK
jgi:hypothetical protein